MKMIFWRLVRLRTVSRLSRSSFWTPSGKSWWMLWMPMVTAPWPSRSGRRFCSRDWTQNASSSTSWKAWTFRILWFSRSRYLTVFTRKRDWKVKSKSCAQLRTESNSSAKSKFSKSRKQWSKRSKNSNSKSRTLASRMKKIRWPLMKKCAVAAFKRKQMSRLSTRCSWRPKRTLK